MSQKEIPTKSSGFKTELFAKTDELLNDATKDEIAAAFAALDLIKLNIMRISLKMHDRLQH